MSVPAPLPWAVFVSEVGRKLAMDEIGRQDEKKDPFLVNGTNQGSPKPKGRSLPSRFSGRNQRTRMGMRILGSPLELISAARRHVGRRRYASARKSS
jgi:hypothetical protein